METSDMDFLNNHGNCMYGNKRKMPRMYGGN